jgi:Fe-S oxidoreductase
MKRVFAPGCALMIYKPELAEKLHAMLVRHLGPMDLLLTCCKHVPPLEAGTEVVNICPGCDRRYRENYKDSTTISLWEVLARDSFFTFPDCKGRNMTIIDACPTRDQARVQDAVRELLRRMNITLVEPKFTRGRSTCCGDIYWGEVTTAEVVRRMEKKAAEMPEDEIVVYCVSCVKAMFVGGKRPRYLVDLLFGEETVPKTIEPDAWHKELDAFIDSHR